MEKKNVVRVVDASSRGKKRSRTESNSSDQRRHKSRLSSKSQPGSSREASPYDLSRQGSRKDRGSTSSTTTTAAASTAHRRARADQSYDIDSIVIPSYSMCSLKPTKVEYKEIPTPRWRPITPASQAYQQTWRNHSEVASSKRVMLDHLFAVLHFSSEEEERRRLMGTTGAVAQGRGRARKNTVNASSGTLTPARATSPLSVDQGSEQSGAFSPSLSSPPPTPQSMDAIAADSRDLYTSSKSSLRGKTFGARSASKDEHLHSPESSSYYERRKFPMSESEFASVLHREAEDGGEHGKRVVGQRATKPPIKRSAVLDVRSESENVRLPAERTSSQFGKKITIRSQKRQLTGFLDEKRLNGN
ncbi:unnamed protein product [Notodromas monacha]|uniref:Uncharacterized protein n=1 Tax=Notodromas monacha TaxID=399045 RepID=A0A7R9BW78_9CRUS|nr:unnamed protein product [Notodromas monacha]CAG0921920.1 unnamed protein product [Notodromas monacha]